VGSQRGGRGKERGFSLGVVVVDILVAVGSLDNAIIEVFRSLGCMYSLLVEGGWAVRYCGGGALTKMMLTFICWSLKHRAFPTSSPPSQHGFDRNTCNHKNLVGLDMCGRRPHCTHG
jgi:hypothetical protein